MLPLIENPDWEKIPIPTIGDIVRLRIEDPLTYLIQAKVESIRENEIQVELINVFDWDTGGQVTSETEKYIGKKEIVKPEQIWKKI